MEPRGDDALAERFEAALDRMGAYFMGSSPVQRAAEQISRILDELNGVKVDFLIEGDYPGDGKPKPVSFPSPALAGTEAGHMRVVDLKHFVEMKLASGMSAPHRLQDLADVLRLIAVAKLPRELSETLAPYVRAKYEELWQSAQHPDEDY